MFSDEFNNDLMFKKISKISRIILTVIVSFALFSCSPQVHVTRYGISKKSYPPREEQELVAVYKNPQNIPVGSKQIEKLQSSCSKWMENCDSASILSLAKTKINKAGGNTLLITEYENPTYWNNSKLLLNGDIFFVSDFSSCPDSVKKFNFFDNKHFYTGIGTGPETGISLILPKVSIYSFHNRKILSTYYGIEGCIGIFNSPWFSLDCVYGVKKHVFTLDTSLGIWWFPKHNYDEPVESYFHSTINPKLGVEFWKIWLKAGPSIHMYKNYPKEQKRIGMVDLVKIGNMYFNFEILIKI
jgi:hypothetical protein